MDSVWPIRIAWVINVIIEFDNESLIGYNNTQAFDNNDNAHVISCCSLKHNSYNNDVNSFSYISLFKRGIHVNIDV